MQSYNHKQIPKSIAIFGANGRSGQYVAKWLRFNAPEIHLRLIGTNPGSVAQLAREFPGAEVVQADYLDRPSLDAAAAGMEGMYVVTREFVDEELAMGNLVAAVQRADCLIHMIRITGLQPDANPRRVPKVLQDFRLGIEIQHEIARKVLDDADIPVTYLNIGASMMQNYVGWRVPMLVNGSSRALVLPHRLIPFIDAREIGEASARLMISNNHRHLYQFYTLNNGHDLLTTAELVRMMAEVAQQDIAHAPTREEFDAFFNPLVEAGILPKEQPEYIWNFLDYERENETIWMPNQYLERILGRPPITMRAFLQEHRHLILPGQEGGPGQEGQSGRP